MDKKEDILISIIIPCYNGAPHIEACLSSVRTQTYPHIEIIFWDDGSQDATPQMLADWQQKDSRIRYFRTEKNKGIGAARNAAIRQVKGLYFFFLDVDDTLLPHIVAFFVRMAKLYPKGEVFVGDFDFIFKNKKRHFQALPDHRQGTPLHTEELLLKILCFTAAKCFRTDFFRQNKLLYPEPFLEFEDVLLWAHLVAQNPRVYYIKEVIYQYYYQPLSNSNNFYLAKFVSRLKALQYLWDTTIYKKIAENPIFLAYYLERLFKILELTIGRKTRKDRKEMIVLLIPYLKKWVAYFKKEKIINTISDYFFYVRKKDVRIAIIAYFVIAFLSKISFKGSVYSLLFVSLIYRAALWIKIYVLRIYFFK